MVFIFQYICRRCKWLFTNFPAIWNFSRDNLSTSSTYFQPLICKLGLLEFREIRQSIRQTILSIKRNIGRNSFCSLTVQKQLVKYGSRFKIRRAKFQGAQFLVSFSQLPAVRKDTEKFAPGKFFGPSYFVTTLPIL